MSFARQPDPSTDPERRKAKMRQLNEKLTDYDKVYNGIRTPYQVEHDCCVLNLDSPSYPPEVDEYRQCGCSFCLKRLAKEIG